MHESGAFGKAVPTGPRSRKKSHGVAPSKHSNSSRIRAQVMRKQQPEKMPHVAYGTL